MELEHRVRLLFGKQLCAVAVRADLLRNEARLLVHVAGEHLHLAHAFVAQAVDGTANVLPHLVHRIEHTDDATAYADVVRDAHAADLHAVQRSNVVFLHKFQAAHTHDLAVYNSATAAGNLGNDLVVLRDLRAHAAAVGKDRARQRVRAGLLRGHCHGGAS